MNRSEVQAELKEVISDAFKAQTLWTTDWAGVQLKRWRLSLSCSPCCLSAEFLCCDKPHAEAAPSVQHPEAEKVSVWTVRNVDFG